MTGGGIPLPVRIQNSGICQSFIVSVRAEWLVCPCPKAKLHRITAKIGQRKGRIL